MAVELLESFSVLFLVVGSEEVDVCRDAVGFESFELLLEKRGRSPAEVGVEGTLLSDFLLLAEVTSADAAPEPVDAAVAASWLLFCFLILAISSSSLTWRPVTRPLPVGGRGWDGLGNCPAVVDVTFKLSVVGGVGFLLRPFNSTS